MNDGWGAALLLLTGFILGVDAMLITLYLLRARKRDRDEDGRP
jgi:hypothetical protein